MAHVGVVKAALWNARFRWVQVGPASYPCVWFGRQMSWDSVCPSQEAQRLRAECLCVVRGILQPWGFAADDSQPGTSFFAARHSVVVAFCWRSPIVDCPGSVQHTDQQRQGPSCLWRSHWKPEGGSLLSDTCTSAQPLREGRVGDTWEPAPQVEEWPGNR